MFSTVCHQESYKLIQFDGHHSLVCARCAGIYIGALAISLVNLGFTLRIKNLEKIFLISGFLVFSDVVCYSMGIYSYSRLIAFSVGLIIRFQWIFIFLYWI